MTTIRFEIVNADGGVEVDNGMLSSPEYRTPVDDALGIAAGFPAGWRVRLWKDVPLVGGLHNLGDPHAEVTVPYPTGDGWQRQLPLVGAGGDCGGDVQVSDAWDARWCKPLTDGTTALVTRSFYIIDESMEGVGPFRLERRTEYLICADPADPGGTEEWSDYIDEIVAEDVDPCDRGGVAAAAADAAEPTDDEWYRHAPQRAELA
jgi:hypothetical protein